MKIIVSLLLVLVCGTVQAQTLKEKADYNKSVTAFMGGMSQLKSAEVNTMKAVGDYLHKIATIQELQEKVRSAKMDNEMKVAEQFYAKRKLYETNRKPRVRPDTKKLESLADQQRPIRLTGFSDKRIEWPTIFDQDRFIQVKEKVQGLLKKRTPQNSGYGSNNYNQVRQQIKLMKTSLKSYISTMEPMEYLAAKKFLESLEYEVRFKANSTRNLMASYVQ
jgi:hypothetical protein